MGEEVVRGPAVHSKADEARRALHAARRRRPPGPSRPGPEPAPEATAATPASAEEPVRPPVADDEVRALIEENQALRAQIAELRARLARIHEQTRPPGEG